MCLALKLSDGFSADFEDEDVDGGGCSESLILKLEHNLNRVEKFNIIYLEMYFCFLLFTLQFSFQWLVKVQSGVHNDPDDEEPGGGGHESLLGEFPGSSELFLVDLLEGGPVGVEEGGVDGGEADDPGSTGDPEAAPREAEEHAEQLSEPVDYVEEVVLFGPRRVRRESATELPRI